MTLTIRVLVDLCSGRSETIIGFHFSVDRLIDFIFINGIRSENSPRKAQRAFLSPRVAIDGQLFYCESVLSKAMLFRLCGDITILFNSHPWANDRQSTNKPFFSQWANTCWYAQDPAVNDISSFTKGAFYSHLLCGGFPTGSMT
jgi:hypothetical protein